MKVSSSCHWLNVVFVIMTRHCGKVGVEEIGIALEEFIVQFCQCRVEETVGL